MPNCAEGGVLGALADLVGAIQATETVKLILGRGQTLKGRLLLIDAFNLKFRELALRKDPGCPLCGANPTITGLIDYEGFCGFTSASAAAVDGTPELAPAELKARMDRGDAVQLIDVREPYEWEISHLFGATLIPLSELPGHLHELTSSDPIVVYCSTGRRSAEALNLLQSAGFHQVEHLKGGIAAWAREVDPTVTVY